MEANVCNGFPVDVMELTALTTAMLRISGRIGIRRRPNAKEPLTIVNDASAKSGGP
jgi:hypothetical protein